jgi:hypothetical protein
MAVRGIREQRALPALHDPREAPAIPATPPARCRENDGAVERCQRSTAWSFRRAGIEMPPDDGRRPRIQNAAVDVRQPYRAQPAEGLLGKDERQRMGEGASRRSRTRYARDIRSAPLSSPSSSDSTSRVWHGGRSTSRHRSEPRRRRRGRQSWDRTCRRRSARGLQPVCRGPVRRALRLQGHPFLGDARCSALSEEGSFLPDIPCVGCPT